SIAWLTPIAATTMLRWVSMNSRLDIRRPSYKRVVSADDITKYVLSLSLQPRRPSMWLHRNGGSLPADGVLEKIGGGGGAFGGRGHPAGELAGALGVRRGEDDAQTLDQ